MNEVDGTNAMTHRRWAHDLCAYLAKRVLRLTSLDSDLRLPGSYFFRAVFGQNVKSAENAKENLHTKVVESVVRSIEAKS